MMKIKAEIHVTEGGLVQERFGTDFKGDLTLNDFFEFTKSNLIFIADAALREEQALGFDPKPLVLVDGRDGKAIADVNPLGQIDYIARADALDVLLEIYQGLIDRSPVLTGRYKSSHIVFHNGEQVAADLPSLQAWIATNPEIKDKDFIRLVDIQPYARKLERHGVTRDTQGKDPNNRYKKNKKGINVLVPNGVYYLTYRAIRAKYGKNLNIKFDFVSGEALGLAEDHHPANLPRAKKFAGNFIPKPGKVGRPYLYPTILIVVLGNGVSNVE